MSSHSGSYLSSASEHSSHGDQGSQYSSSTNSHSEYSGDGEAHSDHKRSGGTSPNSSSVSSRSVADEVNAVAHVWVVAGSASGSHKEDPKFPVSANNIHSTLQTDELNRGCIVNREADQKRTLPTTVTLAADANNALIFHAPGIPRNQDYGLYSKTQTQQTYPASTYQTTTTTTTQHGGQYIEHPGTTHMTTSYPYHSGLTYNANASPNQSGITTYNVNASPNQSGITTYNASPNQSGITTYNASPYQTGITTYNPTGNTQIKYAERSMGPYRTGEADTVHTQYSNQGASTFVTGDNRMNIAPHTVVGQTSGMPTIYAGEHAGQRATGTEDKSSTTHTTTTLALKPLQTGASPRQIQMISGTFPLQTNTGISGQFGASSANYGGFSQSVVTDGIHSVISRRITGGGDTEFQYPRPFGSSPLVDPSVLARAFESGNLPGVRKVARKLEGLMASSFGGDGSELNRSSRWSTEGRWLNATRTGPVSYPDCIMVNHPAFPQGQVPSPLALFYFDETAPNRILLRNDNLDHTQRAQIAANHCKKFVACGGGENKIRDELYQSTGPVSTVSSVSTVASPDEGEVEESVSTSTDSASSTYTATLTADSLDAHKNRIDQSYASGLGQRKQTGAFACCGGGRKQTGTSVSPTLRHSASDLISSSASSMSGTVDRLQPSSARVPSSMHDTISFTASQHKRAPMAKKQGGGICCGGQASRGPSNARHSGQADEPYSATVTSSSGSSFVSSASSIKPHSQSHPQQKIVRGPSLTSTQAQLEGLYHGNQQIQTAVGPGGWQAPFYIPPTKESYRESVSNYKEMTGKQPKQQPKQRHGQGLNQVPESYVRSYSAHSGVSASQQRKSTMLASAQMSSRSGKSRPSIQSSRTIFSVAPPKRSRGACCGGTSSRGASIATKDELMSHRGRDSTRSRQTSRRDSRSRSARVPSTQISGKPPHPSSVSRHSAYAPSLTTRSQVSYVEEATCCGGRKKKYVLSEVPHSRTHTATSRSHMSTSHSRTRTPTSRSRISTSVSKHPLSARQITEATVTDAAEGLEFESVCASEESIARTDVETTNCCGGRSRKQDPRRSSSMKHYELGSSTSSLSSASNVTLADERMTITMDDTRQMDDRRSSRKDFTDEPDTRSHATTMRSHATMQSDVTNGRTFHCCGGRQAKGVPMQRPSLSSTSTASSSAESVSGSSYTVTNSDVSRVMSHTATHSAAASLGISSRLYDEYKGQAGISGVSSRVSSRHPPSSHRGISGVSSAIPHKLGSRNTGTYTGQTGTHTYLSNIDEASEYNKGASTVPRKGLADKCFSSQTGSCMQPGAQQKFGVRKFYYQADASSMKTPHSSLPQYSTSYKNYPLMCFDMLVPDDPGQYQNTLENRLPPNFY